MNESIKKINEKRQAVKKYSDKTIPAADWEQVLSAIYWAPTSHGAEPYRVVTIKKDSPLREKLFDSMWKQGIVKEADKLVFFVSLKREVFTSDEWLFQRTLRKQQEVTGKTGVEAVEGAKAHAKLLKDTHLKIEEPNGDDWAMKQAYIALGLGMGAATLLNIGTTPIEGMVKSEVEKLFLSEGLITDKERIAVAFAAGYPDSETSYAHWGTGKRVRDDWDFKFKEY